MPVAVQELTIQRGSRTLAALLVAPEAREASGAGLLFAHGLHSDQGGYAERAEAASAELGATCLTFDLGGHGGSSGDLARFTLRDHLGDLLAAYDVLARRDGVDARRMGICAASYGAYLAAHSTSERPAKRLLLRAPALYADADLETPITKLQSATEPVPAEATLAMLGRYGGDVLIVESERDEVIATSTVEAYRAAFAHASHRTIPEATHALVEPAWRRLFVELILSWFGEL